MQRQNLRVILALEYPEVQHFLKAMLEEDGSVIVGQAQDAPKALTLARNLRPDVVLVDCHLPHVVGPDIVPLSRAGGLDTAQTISEELPNIRVILLNNLDAEISAGYGLGSNDTAIFSIERMGVEASFALRDLYYEVVQPNALVFASVEVKPSASQRQQISNIRSIDILFVSLSILGGLSLILVLFLIEAWVILWFTGAAATGFGIGLLIKRLKQARTKR